MTTDFATLGGAAAQAPLNALMPGVGGITAAFDKNKSTKGKILSVIEPSGIASALCGGKSKKKQKPPPAWAKIPGGKSTWQGLQTLKGANYLLPATLDVTRRASEGFGDIYRAEADKTRMDELQGFERYGGRYNQAIVDADPLRQKTQAMLLANLDQGLDPAMRREVQQGSRAAYTARGLGRSNASAVEELLNSGAAGKNLESRNLDQAMRFSGATDAFQAYSGRPSAPQGSNVMAPNYAGIANNDQYNYRINQEIMANNNAQAAKTRQNATTNALIGAAGQVVGGAASFI